MSFQWEVMHDSCEQRINNRPTPLIDLKEIAKLLGIGLAALVIALIALGLMEIVGWV